MTFEALSLHRYPCIQSSDPAGLRRPELGLAGKQLQQSLDTHDDSYAYTNVYQNESSVLLLLLIL
jgi:hypothetical protein